MRKRLLRCYAGVSLEDITKVTTECAKIRKHREQSRRSSATTMKTSLRHVLSKVTGGMLGARASKHLPASCVGPTATATTSTSRRHRHPQHVGKSVAVNATIGSSSRQEIRI